MDLIKTIQVEVIKPFKYEMMKRKEKWKTINEPLENLLIIPPEAQSSVVRQLLSKTCYNSLADMLELPPIEVSQEACPSAVDNALTLIPTNEEPLIQVQDIKLPFITTLSESTMTQYEPLPDKYVNSVSKSQLSSLKNKTIHSLENHDILSDFVEVENKVHADHELILKHKAILKFLNLLETEVATWRVKEAKDISELSEMTLEEQGDFLISKVIITLLKTAMDFCEWMRKLGGDEKSLITEEILKELFQIGMDNPASRAICTNMKEKRVLYYKLAEFLQVPKKSFHKVLSLHLKWDAKEEKKPQKLVAFGKFLPKDFRSKTPQNKTTEIWLEWNKLLADQLGFDDVYSKITDLRHIGFDDRSTKEYCKWLVTHPEFKKPKYLIDQGMFDHRDSGKKNNGS